MKFHSKKISLIFTAFSLIFSIAACHHYYMAVKPTANNPGQKASIVDSLQKEDRYFILRNGGEAYHIKNMSLSDDSKTIGCTLETLPANHLLHLNKGRRGVMQYKPTEPNDAGVLNEVHFYISPDTSISAGHCVLQLDKIQKIEVIQNDKGRTTGSYIIGALGYTIGAIAVVAIIVAATKSSCPFVSAYTNDEFLLQGEIYGGAIYPQMARDDYMPLRIQPTADQKLMVKISNELHERQYTDFADMMVITHDKDSKILSDEKGNLYEVKNPQSPLKAWTGNMPDALSPLLKKDDNELLHFDDTLSADANNYVITKFNKPAGRQKGKLVLAIKNSYWLDYLYGEMAKGFGSYYGTFIKKQNKTPLSTLLQWTKDQKIPLEVSVKTKAGWEKMADLTTIGPLATREIVVPLDLKNVLDSSVEIRLSSGFMFWEIDYAAIDYSDDKNFDIATISPSVATDETGKNVLPELNKEDGIYLEQPVPGNCVTLEYQSKAARPNTIQSYILHTKGYYSHVRDFKGAPNVSFLKQFKKPGGFPSFSLQLYKKFGTTTMESLVKR
jgi:hypothetical protein